MRRTLGFVAIQEPTVLQTPEGFKYLPPSQEAAWLGLLQVHAEHASLRMSQLAERTQLSLSRVSRVIDQLEQRGLVERRSCATDSRVVYATLIDDGRRLVAEAQETFFDVIEERFLGHLTCDEVALLGNIFGRLVSSPPDPACATRVEPPSS